MRSTGSSSRLAILLAGFTGTTLVFLWLATTVAQGAHSSVDATLLQTLQDLRRPSFDAVMVGVSYIGYRFPFVPLVGIVSLAVWRGHGAVEAALVLLSPLSAAGVSLLVKEVVARPRPAGADIWIYEKLNEFSFPSNHVVIYLAFFGLLCYLAATRWHGRPYRWLVIELSILAIALVGPSRVYLGAHWPSDVFAGYLLGFVWLALTIVASRHLLAAWPKSSHAADSFAATSSNRPASRDPS